MVCSRKLPHAGKIKGKMERRKENTKKRNKKAANKFLYLYRKEDGEKSQGKSHAKPLHFLFSWPCSIAVDGERRTGGLYTKLNSRGNDDTVETNSKRRQTIKRVKVEKEEDPKRINNWHVYKKTMEDIKNLIEVDLPLSCLYTSPTVRI